MSWFNPTKEELQRKLERKYAELVEIREKLKSYNEETQKVTDAIIESNSNLKKFENDYEQYKNIELGRNKNAETLANFAADTKKLNEKMQSILKDMKKINERLEKFISVPKQDV